MGDGARLGAKEYRDMAAYFRTLAEAEPLASLRRHLRWLASQHDELAADIAVPGAREQETMQKARS